MTKSNELYGVRWQSGEPLAIEMKCIQLGGEWTDKAGKKCGNGLAFHYTRMMRLIWPGEWWSRWDHLIIAELTRSNRVFLGIAGPSSASKTHRVSRFALCLYFCFPNQTTVLCSTTTRDMLEMRIWGEIKKGFRIARERFSWLPGIFIESKQMLITDEKTEDGREFRCGIKGVACKKGGQWEGLGDYVGIKNDIVMLAADEAHLMEPGFFDASGNLASNERFILAAMANPKDTTDAFGSICEPLAGWDTHDQGDKTQVWDTRFRNGRCLRLVGTDSPNLDRADGLVMFPKLIGQRYISEIENTYGRESWQFLMWVMAKFPISALERRVITRAMCIKFHAFELPQFGNTITKLFAMDAAYSAVGGDRCIGMELAFGRCTDGISRVAMVGKPMLIPVSQEKGLPEDQIARWVMEYCTQRDIPPRHVFFDGTGRSSLMYAFGRLWSPEVVPLEFGGIATDRPSPADPRKTCRDLYGKFVTELWYVTRTLIESDQFRGMTEEVCQEGCLRAWTLSKSGKADVEPKDETKLRLGRSPDLFDTLVSGVEGARRLGFTIGKQAVRDETGRSELLKLRQQWSDVLKSRQLTNA